MSFLAIYFKDGINGIPQNWTPYLSSMNKIKKQTESEKEGEAGVITYDRVKLVFEYREGNPIYEAFNTDLSSKQKYIFEIYGLKTTKAAVSEFVGIADFSTIGWPDGEKKISFDVLDKLSGLEIVENGLSRTQINFADRINNPDYLLYSVQMRNGQYTYYGTQKSIYVDIEHYSTGLHLDTPENIVNVGEVIRLGDESFYVTRYYREEVRRYEADQTLIEAYQRGVIIVIATGDVPAFTELPSDFKIYGDLFYGVDIVNKVMDGSYIQSITFDAKKIIGAIYNQAWGTTSLINRTGAAQSNLVHNYLTQLIDESPFGKHPLDALKMLADSIECYIYTNKTGELVVQKRGTQLGSNGVTRTLSNTKLKKNGTKKYMWNKIVDEVSITVNSWAKDAEGNQLSGNYTIGKNPNIKARNPFSKEILAIDSSANTQSALDTYASSIAQNYFNFYGNRHFAYSVTLKMNNDMFDWDLLDNITIDGTQYFFVSLSIDLMTRYLEAELVSVLSYNYDSSQAHIILSESNSANYFASNPSGSTSGVTNLNTILINLSQLDVSTGVLAQKGDTTFTKRKIKGTENGIKVVDANGDVNEYGITDDFTVKLHDDVKIVNALAIAGNLDAAYKLKVYGSSNITVDQKIDGNQAIGGAVDASFRQKIYGNVKVTGNITVDGDVYIGGAINQVNVQDLDVVDHVIRLNKGGDDTTALQGGIDLLGASNLSLASIKYNGSWLSSTHFDLAANKVYKINTAEVLSATTLGSSVIYSSLVQVGSLNHSLNINNGFVYKINNAEVLSATTLGVSVVNSSLTKVGIVTNGEWKATQVADTYIASAVNWNDANSKKHVHANAAVLDATTASFTSALKTSYDSAVAASHSHSNISHLNAIDQSVATIASPSFANITLSNGELITGVSNNLVLNPAGKAVVPKQTYDVSLGSATLKYLSIYGAELAVGQLVAQSTIATIGGRILVGRTTTLIAAVNNSQITIDVKHNNLNSGDRIYLEGNGNIEFLAITSSASAITGGYRYNVTRNLDGSGANNWNSGDAVFNTGTTGEGFIDIYSISGIKNTQYGPAIVGNVRNTTTYNDWTEHWAIGNLNGLYGYNSNTYGVGLGKYSSDASHLVVDATNGARIRKGTTTLAQWDVNGNIVIGEVGAGKSNVYISSGAVQLRNNTTALLSLNSDGSISSTATITGATLITNATVGNAYAKLFSFTQSAGVTSGALELGYNNSAIKKAYTDGVYGPAGSYSQVYNEYFATTNVIMKELSFVNVNSGAYTYNLEEIVFRTSANPGVLTSKDKYFYYNKALFNELQFGTNSANHDVNLYRGSANVLKTDDAFDAVGGFKVNGAALATTHLTALTASKIAVTDSSGFLAASSIASSELFAPVYGAMKHTNNTTTISSDVDWIKYTGFVSAFVKNSSVANSTITVNNDGTYIITYSITFTKTVNTGNTLYFDAFIAGGNSSNEAGKRATKVRDTNTETISNSFTMTLSANDTIDLRMYSTDVDTITVVYAQLSAVKISN